MFRLVLPALLLLGSLLRADEVALIRIGDSWRYFKGTMEASSPASAWREIGFDDSTWLSGPSGFSVGFGSCSEVSFNEATLLCDLPGRYASVFFRKRFTVSDPATIAWLILRADYDDGFVAYLNGQEIARKNIPGAVGSPVPFDATAATIRPRGEAEDIEVSAFTGLLVRGENVLAIQAHNYYLSDFTFALVPELLANFNRGPFVQNASTNSIQIIWRTPIPASSKVEYGIEASMNLAIADSALVTNHAVSLTNLAPGTQYFYRVISTTSERTVVSPPESFRSLKSSGDLSFAVFGDSGSGMIQQYQIADRIREAAPDLVKHVGDVIYPEFTTGRTDLKCLSVYRPHMQNTPYYFAFGNHDLYATNGDQPFLEAFYLPTNSMSGTEHYYSFDHGDAHFAVLFVPFLYQYAQFPQYRLDIGSPQYNWLTNDLARTTKPWRFLFFHVPINSSGAHRFDDLNLNGVPDCVDIQQWLMPVARQYGVQMIFNGHDHNYERFIPTNGVSSIVTGGGGIYLRYLAQRDFGSCQFSIRYHFTKVSIQGDTLRIEAIDNAGQVFDSMTLQRALPPPKIYDANWHTPDLGTALPDDGDGNRLGQAFDLIGTPIPTLAGQFSNLGRVFVNNDATNLYAGFEQSMIHGDNNVFLFIESPRLAGVTNLAGLGNGLVDPFAQGVDGLDFLENLSFTNFAPGIGCVLGDELGDGQFRNFARIGLPLNLGQGVFFLDQTLSDIPGARLQQFNRSPQIAAEFGEQNADLMEVAIPLSALGNLQPGDQLKIGAVVGGPNFNLTEQTRELDSSFLGTALHQLEKGMTALSGVSVRLAPNPDPDFDGLTTAQEIALGTNPNNPDSDSDGLWDGWEARHGFNPLSPLGAGEAAGDPDGDGFTNAQEQLAGTDPRDPKSALRLSLLALSGVRLRISWQAVPGRTYQLEISDAQPTNFVAIGIGNFPRVASSGVETYDDDLTLLQPRPFARYYRVRLVP
ncbi:MAG TPA: metallophosphoesterase [Candidatus Eisenbacteria bacterium]|nr:metallophosphoesterase [Candidatus Eisenbacteria bacterium]